MSTTITESPAVRFAPSMRGPVRPSSSIRSVCSAREVRIFCPLTTKCSPSRFAVARIEEVAEPLVDSVTPKACSRSRPPAMSGSHCACCGALE
jgi:hypothetical protein